MKRWILAIVTVVAISAVGVSTASAQGYGGCHTGYGYRSSGYGGYSGHGRYSAGYGSRWHDTSHYDYHPGSYQRHRNHYHYVPGHYHYHRTGHFH